MKIAGIGLLKITVQQQQQDVEEPQTLSFHLLTQDKEAASDGPCLPAAIRHTGWSVGECLSACGQINRTYKKIWS